MSKIDELGTTRKLPWILTLIYVDGRGWEAQCADPAVAVIKLNDLLEEHGIQGVADITIRFDSGNELAGRTT